VLDELCKRDSEWRKLATRICGDAYLADDLVQEMYLKLLNKKEKVNTSYIHITLLSIYIDHLRKQKETELNENITDDNDFCNASEEISKRIGKLPNDQRNIMLLKQYKTFREIENELDIKLSRVYSDYRKGINKLKKDPQLKQLYYEITGKKAT